MLGQSVFAEQVSIVAGSNERVTIYKRYGLDYVRCMPQVAKATGCITSGDNQDAIGWPTGSSKVELIKDKNDKPMSYTSEGVHPVYHDFRSETWFKVRVTYQTNGKTITKEGWLEESNLQIEKDPPRKEIPTPCPPKSNRLKSNRKEIAQSLDIKNLSDQIHKQILQPADEKVKKAADALYGVIGRCEIDPPLTAAPKSWNQKTPIYDQVVLKNIQAQSKRLPMISAQAGVSISPQQLIEIDMLARTLYGEMGKCEYRGPQYSQMVARVILNRAEFEKGYKTKMKDTAFTKESDFFKMKHREDETEIQAVMSTARQFNPWDQYFYKRDKKNKEPIANFNESGLSQALCPPSSPDKYWGSYLNANSETKVSELEQKTWQDIAKIATEAILFPEQFKEKTKPVADIFLFQTKITKGQKMDVFQGQPRVSRSIQGRALNVETCAVVYKGEAWKLKYLESK